MARTGIRKEEKFEGEAQRSVPDLRGLPGVARVVDAPPEELDAVYYDTADLVLLGGRCTLRRRTGGDGAGWQLRAPARQAGRREIELPLDAGDPGALPQQMVRRVRGRTRGRRITPVAHLHTRRERKLLVDADGRTLAEVSRDNVSAQILGAEDLGEPGEDLLAMLDTSYHVGGTSARLTAWSRVAVELGDGDGKLLNAVSKRLRSAGLKPSKRSSCELRHALSDAGLAPVGAKAAPDPAPGTAAAAVLTRLRAQAAILLDADTGVRADEPGSVHRMRVAARRLRATLQTYRRLFRADRTRRLEEELSWLRAMLAEARDHEVLAERLQAETGALHDDPRIVSLNRDSGDHIAAYESHAYRRAWRAAARELDGRRYFALLDTLDGWIADPPFSAKADREAAGRLEKGVRREHRKLSARMDRALGLPPGTERDEALHSARKAAKRLRYAAETARPVAGRSADRLVRRARAVQRVLGAHQDAVVARDALPALADQAHDDQRNTFAYGLLYARLMHEADRTAREVPAVWAEASARKLTRLR